MWWNRKNPKPAPEAAPTADEVPSTVNRNALLLAGLGGGVLAVFGLAAISSIVAPVFLALVLTICASPVRTALERRRVPTGIATGVAIVTVLALIVVFGYAVAVAFSQFASLLPQFAPQIQAAVASVGEALSKIGIGSDQISAAIGSFDAGSIVSVVWGLIGGLAGATTTFVIIFTMVLLMAMDSALLPGVLRRIEPHRALFVHSIRDYAKNVRRYMVVTTALGVAQGLINWFVLVLLGVPGAFIWGLLSFICSFIPNVGYFIAIIPPIVFGALTGGWPTVIAVIVLYGVVNAGVQSIIQPRVVGNAVALSQSITFFSVLFWAIVLGPTGAILAIPLTLLVRMLLVDTNPRMPWIKPLLGDNTASKLEKAEAKAAAAAGKAAGSGPGATAADTSGVPESVEAAGADSPDDPAPASR